MRTINVGVVGVGAMGENHVRVYHKMEEANLVAVSDVSERALKKIEKKYPFQQLYMMRMEIELI